ncbi:MAG: hypothetical protein V4662_04530 [Verrucomicrobiota bacterium]
MRARFGRQTGGISFFAFQDIITGTSGFLIALALFMALNLDEKLAEHTAEAPHAKRVEELSSMQAQIISVKQEVADWQQQPDMDETTLRRLIGQLTTSIAEMDARPTPGMNQEADATGREAKLRQEKEKLLTRMEGMNASIHEGELLASGLVKDIPDLEKKLLDLQSSLQRGKTRKNVISLIPERDGSNKEPVLVLVQGSLIRYQRPDGTPGGSGSINDFVTYIRAVSPKTHYIVFYFKPSGSQHFEMLTKRARSEGYQIGYDVIPEDLEVEFSNEASVKGGRR